MTIDVYYKAGGALSGEQPDADSYIERGADNKALVCLRRMEYITLTEPRQQGKTSLIWRLCHALAPENYLFAYVDLTTLSRADEVRWKPSFCECIIGQVYPHIRKRVPRSIDASSGWIPFFEGLAQPVSDNRAKLVVVLDETGAFPQERSTEFFSCVRSAYNQHYRCPALSHLTFIVAGVFNPRHLIQDDDISGWNIDHRIELTDFTQEEVRKSVERMGLAPDLTETLAGRIHHWTDGQPYLVQYLCRSLADGDVSRSPAGVDEAVERFSHSERNHIARLRAHLDHQTPEAREYLAKILLGESIVFDPVNNPVQAKLELVGIIKRAPNNTCIIRNLIYERALSDALSGSTVTSQAIDSHKAGKECRILLAFASPRGRVYIDFAEEYHEIEEKIRGTSHAGAMKLIPKFGVRWDGLIQAVDEERPRILHFSVHGREEGGIILLNARGRSQSISPQALVKLFKDLKGDIQLIILNCCYADSLAKEAAKIVGCAIGMTNEVSVQAAVAFAGVFYRAVGSGSSIKKAYDLGAAAMMPMPLAGTARPVLCSVGVDPDALVLVGPAGKSSHH